MAEEEIKQGVSMEDVVEWLGQERLNFYMANKTIKSLLLEIDNLKSVKPTE
jgi:hypothetical protein